MKLIAQIENALKAIDQARFQNLVNHLLVLQGNKFVGAPGATVGKEKTSKGTPDSFFVNNAKYTFVECTTKEKVGESKSLLKKLSNDIDHCFNEEITSVRRLLVERVVLACNDKINTEEYEILKNKVRFYNPEAQLEVFNIQNLSILLYEFPKLAEEYLDIPILKGDIFPLYDFLEKTKKSLQPSLTNEFIGRDEELANCLKFLNKYDVLLFSGGAGVGKSKLAVKILEELSKENYAPLVIQASTVSLWDDYVHLFLPGRRYVILFDDANKSIVNLNYLLGKIFSSQLYSAKIIITSRDYVKNEVVKLLENYQYKEIKLPVFKDEDIKKLIHAALPRLKYYRDISQKIIDLAKGNARIALMATYSLTPESDTKYLNSPVLLYEKYFSKISMEIQTFRNPTVLKSLAIVSFFGVLEKNNEELKVILEDDFGIDWDDLWLAITELHNSEIMDVHADEMAKVSDQVLASYAFYTCFIDDRSAIIKYSDWIYSFVGKFSNRIRNTLIDTNNTFEYPHVRNLVLPHLNEALKRFNTEEELYVFYDLFWFYKSRECLLFIKKWIDTQENEVHPEVYVFDYVHNDHVTASRYFELLNRYYHHHNELLKPAIQLTLALLEKQPRRLPEVLKFIYEIFAYKIEDVEQAYFRQETLVSVLLDKDLNIVQKILANGIFLKLAELMLGWHFSNFGNSKGRSINIYNFDLVKSDALMKLRRRILIKVYYLFELENKQLEKVLNKIIYPGGLFDKSIYADELPIYEKFISQKLDNRQYKHCKFVSVLAKHLSDSNIVWPNKWKDFIDSDIRKLSKFLKADWVYNVDKNITESEREKQKEFDDFANGNDWKTIEEFLLKIDTLHRQQKGEEGWRIESAVSSFYLSIARKGCCCIENSLRLFFGRKIQIPINNSIVQFILLENIMTASILLNIIEEYSFPKKIDWTTALLAHVPKDQINESILNLLINTFSNPSEQIYINSMACYLKFQEVFEAYKKENSQLGNHNIITYLTSLLLLKRNKHRNIFGWHLATDCGAYFSNHPNLLKEAYWVQFEIDSHFDYDGKELTCILNYDKYFVNDSLRTGRIGLGYNSTLKLEKVNTRFLWDQDEYEDLIEDLLLTALDKVQYLSLAEDDIKSLFSYRGRTESHIGKAKSLIIKLIQKFNTNEKLLLTLSDVAYHCFQNWYIDFLKILILTNGDIALIRKIRFDRSESWSGSKVPLLEGKIEFLQAILRMLNSLPDVLKYSEHIDLFEQKIIWKKKEIKDEQKSDFQEGTFY